MIRTYNLTAGNYRITEYINDYVDWWLYDPDEYTVASGYEGSSREFTVPKDGVYSLEYMGSSTPSDVGFRLERYEQVEVEITDIYSQPAIVPAAVSSELDNHGEERIHIAPYVDPPELSPDSCMSAIASPNEPSYMFISEMTDIPDTINQAIQDGLPLIVAIPDYSGSLYEFWYSEEYERYETYNSIPELNPEVPYIEAKIAILQDASPSELDWFCLHLQTWAPS